MSEQQDKQDSKSETSISSSSQGEPARTLVEPSGPGTATELGLPPGARPAGDRYIVEARLGEGGAGVVYAARDTMLDRVVALKVLRGEYLEVAEHRARFVDEARVMGGFEHPGTVPVYDVGTLPAGEPFYTMKRVQGRTLRELLSARTSAEVTDRPRLAHFIDVFERVCEAVAAAHVAGLVHRDLKPENVMVDEFGAVYVMDWGLAKKLESAPQQPVDRRTQLGTVIGTPAYIPPEQARGQSHGSGREADVFSLGVILYEILTGVIPFGGATHEQVMQAVLYEDPMPPRRRNPRVPRSLEAVCLKALEKNPLRRYSNAGELEQDIRRFREFLPVTAAAPRFAERVWGWARRHPLATGVAAALTLAVLVSGAAVAVQAAAERQVMAQGFGRIEELRADLDRADAEIDDLEGQLAATAPDGPERARVEEQLEELRERRDLDEQVFKATASAVMGFTRLASDDAMQRVARERLLDAIDRHIATGQFTQAKVAIDWLLSTGRKDNPFGLTAAELTALRARLARVENGLKVQRPGE